MELDNDFTLKNKKTNKKKNTAFWRKHDSPNIYNINITINGIPNSTKEPSPSLEEMNYIDKSNMVLGKIVAEKILNKEPCNLGYLTPFI